jgi:mannose-6-phosphate isomerase-like protein (cupin superfamily)
MNKAQDYINSGILELYVLGLTSTEENLEVTQMSNLYPEVKNEINEISESLLHLSSIVAPKPNPTLRTSILGTIDYIERLKSGESVSNPPILNSKSKISDYEEWISKPEMKIPDDFIDSFAKIIGANEIATTMIVWLTTEAPHEIHHNEFERFLIIEGSCQLTIGNDINYLKSGDYIEIPLHVVHNLIVTSTIPCKVILQRVAA